MLALLLGAASIPIAIVLLGLTTSRSFPIEHCHETMKVVVSDDHRAVTIECDGSSVVYGAKGRMVAVEPEPPAGE